VRLPTTGSHQLHAVGEQQSPRARPVTGSRGGRRSAIGSLSACALDAPRDAVRDALRCAVGGSGTAQSFCSNIDASMRDATRDAVRDALRRRRCRGRSRFAPLSALDALRDGAGDAASPAVRAVCATRRQMVVRVNQVQRSRAPHEARNVNMCHTCIRSGHTERTQPSVDAVW